MAQTPLFYYFGDDEAYFKALNGELKKHCKFPFTFQRHFARKEEAIQALFLLISNNSPKVVFIDFSKETQDYLHLARLIARTEFEEMPLTVGLVDYLSPKDVLFESIATGISLTHIKSAEVFDVAYDISALIAQDSGAGHGFATADLKETWQAGAVSKVGYVSKTGLHLETNFKLTKDERIKLDHFWTKDKLIPSREMVVTNVSQSNLFYHFDTAVDLEFGMIDEIVPAEGADEEDTRDRQAEREELVRRQKKKFASWVDDNLERSQAKHTKFLIVDREFRLFLNQKRSDKYPYIIRCVSHLTEIADELNRLCPQLISVALDPPEVKTAKNDFDFLEKLVAVVKRDHAETSPFIVVFNTKLSTKELREQLGYDHMMATDGELEADVLIKMAGLLDKKITDKQKHLMTEERIYMKKTNPASHALILMDVQVMKLSETDMVFTCNREIPAGMNLHFSQPVSFYAHVRPSKTQGKAPEYTGLIHCIGESDKKELRRFINSVFFRDHDAEQLTQIEEFKNLNESKLKEKLEAIRLAQEKQLAEEEAKKAETAKPTSGESGDGTSG